MNVLELGRVLEKKPEAIIKELRKAKIEVESTEDMITTEAFTYYSLTEDDAVVALARVDKLRLGEVQATSLAKEKADIASIPTDLKLCPHNEKSVVRCANPGTCMNSAEVYSCDFAR